MRRAMPRPMRRSEADARGNVEEVVLVIGERRGGGSHLVAVARLQEDLARRAVAQVHAEGAHAVREVAEEQVAAVVPDVVLGIAADGDLVGRRPARLHHEAFDQHEASALHVRDRADVAVDAARDGELAGGGPGVGEAERGTRPVARGVLVVVAPHPVDAAVDGRVAGRDPMAHDAEAVLVVGEVERRAAQLVVRRASALEAPLDAEAVVARGDVAHARYAGRGLDVVELFLRIAVVLVDRRGAGMQPPARDREPHAVGERLLGAQDVLLSPRGAGLRREVGEGLRVGVAEVARELGRNVPQPRGASDVAVEVELVEMVVAVREPGEVALEALQAVRSVEIHADRSRAHRIGLAVRADHALRIDVLGEAKEVAVVGNIFRGEDLDTVLQERRRGKRGQSGERGDDSGRVNPCYCHCRVRERWTRASIAQKVKPKRDLTPFASYDPFASYGLTMRSASALPTACVRLSTFSLRSVFCTWFFTVSGLMSRIMPISMLLLPW